MLTFKLAQVEFAPKATDRHYYHDAKVDEKDATDGGNHGPSGIFFILEGGGQREQGQVIRGQLEERFVDVFHSEAQLGVVWTGVAQVDHVEDVREEKDVDQDVRVRDAGDREDGVEEPSGEED